MRSASAVACVFAMTLVLWGCGSTPVHRPAAKLEPKPYLLHLPGITGAFSVHDKYLAALNAGGFDAQTGIYDWTNGRVPVFVLGSRQRNREEALKVAALITAKYRADPQRPIYLTCESGGAGIAVWALEALPDDVQVEAAVFIAAAVSPGYDLSPALRHVRSRMYAISSKRDALVLGLGTSLFGTMDRRHGNSAGLVGFKPPAAPAFPEQYAKVEQVPYESKWWSEYGNDGTHWSAMTPRFASGWLAPRLIEIAQQSAESREPIEQASHLPPSPRARGEGQGVGDIEPPVDTTTGACLRAGRFFDVVHRPPLSPALSPGYREEGVTRHEPPR
ncbi:MAG: hypothetical protein WBD40_15020 [Tepidisphaeraceae bacterium]